MRTVIINTKKHKLIGSGAGGSVYRLSPRRVIKVVHKDILRRYREVGASRWSKYCLPVLEVVNIKFRDGKTNGYRGLIKEYLPRQATVKQIDNLRFYFSKFNRLYNLSLDCYGRNVRADKKGNVYLIDTEVRNTFWCESLGRYII